MGWSDPDSWLTNGLAPYKSTIIIAFIISILLPILTHLYLYRSVAAVTTPTFLIVGPSGAGKTALVTKLESSKPARTHTSQTPLTIQTTLPPSTRAHSNRYRTEHDAELTEKKPLLLTDTPGHAKLRHHAYNLITPTTTLPTGIIFVVDSANLSSAKDSSGASALNDTATYLHDYLLHLQRQHTQRKTSKSVEIPFLIAANKTDLFTSLPAQLVKSALENEISAIRRTKASGIASVGNVGKGEGLGGDEEAEQDESESEPLGGTTEGKFDFAVMAEWNVSVDVVGGSVLGLEESDGVEGYWDWIARQL